MSFEPRITVGIPFHDEEAHLHAAIRSVLRQTVTDIEVLLVDDGSRDRSLAIARSFDDPRVRIVSDGEHKQLPARLNEVTRLARAPLVARMDADDVAHPERLAQEVELLEREDLDAVGTWIALVDDEEQPIAVTETPPPASRSAADAVQRGLLAHATMLAKRSWLDANPYDVAFPRAEDRELWCRTFGKARLGVVPEVLYVVRVSTEGSFLNDYAESQRQNRTLLRRHGPSTLGYARTAGALLAVHAKTAVTSTAVHLGVSRRLLSRRGRAPTERELARIREALRPGDYLLYRPTSS